MIAPFSKRRTMPFTISPCAVLVLVEDDVALGLADALDDHLLRGLRDDAAEARRVDLHADLVADLRVGVVRLGVGRG